MNWIKITDATPKDVTPVLVYGECCDACYQIRIAEIEVNEWWESSSGDALTFKVTHWMSLPEIPGEDLGLNH